MLFLPRLPLLLFIIFLGLFCFPQTINCQNPNCDVLLEVETYRNGDPDCQKVTRNTDWCICAPERYCLKEGRTTCIAKCNTAPICYRARGKTHFLWLYTKMWGIWEYSLVGSLVVIKQKVSNFKSDFRLVYVKS